MDDLEIVEKYLKRDEDAIKDTMAKYERLCYSISYRILYDHEDVLECLNDICVKCWKSIPPTIPKSLKAYVSKLARNISLNYKEYNNAKKRCGSSVDVVYEEVEEWMDFGLRECSVETKVTLEQVLNTFLEALNKDDRIIFMKRFYYFYSIKEIASDLGCSQSRVKMSLSRSKRKCKKWLRKEGLVDEL